MKRKPTKKEIKEKKRLAVQIVRRKNGWKPPEGTICYKDKY